jgi:hypothetical protein
MNIRDYILNVEKTYEYRIKTIVPLEDEQMERIESVLMRYDPIRVSNPRKTIFQKMPLDFPSVAGAEIYYVDVELGLPATQYIMATQIRDAIGCAEKFVVVRAKNEPAEVMTDEMDAKAEMMLKAGDLGPMAELENTTDESLPSDDLYGDGRNSKLLGYLAGVKKERDENLKVDSENSLFKWLDMPKNDDAGDPEGFNANIKDAPKVYGHGTPKDGEDKSMWRKVFKDKSGKPVILTRKKGE